jgi:hypothetical protein
MDFKGKQSTGTYDLYTGPCPVQLKQLEYSDQPFGTFLNFTFSNDTYGVRVYGSIKISNELVVSKSGKGQYMPVKGKSFRPTYAETKESIENADNFVACRVGEAQWYEFLQNLFRYADTNETFFEDMVSNKLDFDSVFDRNANFEDLIKYAEENDLGIVTILSVKEKDGEWKQSSLFPYNMYRHYGKDWTADKAGQNSYIAKSIANYMAGDGNQIVSNQFKKFETGPSAQPTQVAQTDDIPF